MRNQLEYDKLIAEHDDIWAELTALWDVYGTEARIDELSHDLISIRIKIRVLTQGGA